MSAHSGMADVSLVKYGSGSIDDDSDSLNKATAPAMMQKVKLDELFAQVSIQETDIDTKLSSGDFTGALRTYDDIYAELTAVPSARDRLENTRSKLTDALNTVTMTPLTVPPATTAGKAFKTAFSVNVSFISKDEKVPLAGFPCTVVHPAVTEDGAKTVATETIMSDDTGCVSLSAPVPKRAEKTTVIFSSRLTSNDEILQEFLSDKINRGEFSISLPYAVTANTKHVSTVISILDFDKNGKAITSSNVSATNLLKPMVKNGFRPVGMADFPKQLSSGDDTVLLKTAKAQFGTSVLRFICGTTHITSLTQDDAGLWHCTLSLDIAVWDLSDDKKTYSTVIIHTETGKTEFAAIDAARKKSTEEELFEELLYNL